MAKAKSTTIAPIAANTSVVMTSKDVPNKIAELQAIKEKLQGNFKENISLDISYGDVHIGKCLSVGKLLEISSAVRARNKAYKEEASVYNVQESVAPLKISDKTEEQWYEILGKAIHELLNKKQLEKINSAIKELETHLDAETKLQRTLAGILDLATAPIN